MPYVNELSRGRFASILREFEELCDPTPALYVTEGELNYVITSLILLWLKQRIRVSYQWINAVMGVLECTKLELYRRMVALYEDDKKEDNGDVYPNFTKGTP